jgi:hypothetical protein
MSSAGIQQPEILDDVALDNPHHLDLIALQKVGPNIMARPGKGEFGPR